MNNSQIVIDETLISYIDYAAQNGDEIAMFIRDELKKDDWSEVFGKMSANFFRPEITWDGSIMSKLAIGYACVDMENEESRKRFELNPDAVYGDNASRIPMSCATFVSKFRGYKKEWARGPLLERFEEALKVASPLKATISDNLWDFKQAYCMDAYAPVGENRETNTLWNSCMRYTPLTDSVASFYKHVCHCKVLVVRNAQNQVVGRAIIWPEVSFYDGRPLDDDDDDYDDDDDDDEYDDDDAYLAPFDGARSWTGSLVSRMYYVCPGVRDFMFRFVEKAGIDIRMASQSSGAFGSFKVLHSTPSMEYSDGEEFRCPYVLAKVYPTYKHKYGAPYVDIFENMIRHDDKLYLVTNAGRFDETPLLDTECTGGVASGFNRICPVCGRSFSSSSDKICPDCMRKYSCRTSLGNYPLVNIVSVKGYGDVPEDCVENGELTPNAANANLVNVLRLNEQGNEGRDERLRY